MHSRRRPKRASSRILVSLSANSRVELGPAKRRSFLVSSKEVPNISDRNFNDGTLGQKCPFFCIAGRNQTQEYEFTDCF